MGRDDQIVVLAEAIVREERAGELLVGRFGNPALHGAVTALADSAVARGVVIRTVMGRRTASDGRRQIVVPAADVHKQAEGQRLNGRRTDAEIAVCCRLVGRGQILVSAEAFVRGKRVPEKLVGVFSERRSGVFVTPDACRSGTFTIQDSSTPRSLMPAPSCRLLCPDEGFNPAGLPS
jgi:hypothetical protein